MRDENGFKCHVQSESHVRQILLVGEDPKKYIDQYSNEFLSDFVKLLRTGHREKKVHINRFYQEYIANKEHIHMNATKWSSLTEFAKYLGKEGICRVEETEKGIFISWIDNSPEALRRQDAVRRKERQDRGDEIRDQQLIEEQIRRAQKDREAAAVSEKTGEVDEEKKTLQKEEGEKIKLSFTPKTVPKKPESVKSGFKLGASSDGKPAKAKNVFKSSSKKDSEGADHKRKRHDEESDNSHLKKQKS